jgi:hypothetical protein
MPDVADPAPPLSGRATRQVWLTPFAQAEIANPENLTRARTRIGSTRCLGFVRREKERFRCSAQNQRPLT